MPMFDCASDVLKYHNEEVTLGTQEQKDMTTRRDANRDRIRDGLEENEDPAAAELKSQGSWVMKTMVQDKENDYDIDDGVYFDKEDLVDENGNDMAPAAARQMVRDAVDDGSFKKKPKVKVNCVRVYYQAGYHVDLPVYRRLKTAVEGVFEYELAAGDDWKKSDARDVSDWFKKENKEQSPDETNGRQLRRITRDIKKMARSRNAWKDEILSGFGITKLVTEQYKRNLAREDTALYNTIKAIRDRLNWNLVVEHPIPGNSNITSGDQDPKAIFLREKLSEILDHLEPLFDPDCTRKEARKAWDKAFNTDFFSSLETEKEKANSVAAPTVLARGLIDAAREAPRNQQKEGGGRYA